MDIPFKVLRLRLKENPVFEDLDVSFYDQQDHPHEPYTTLIIGPNGTGKSNLLRALILLFSELSYFRKNGKRQGRLTGRFSLEYAFDGKLFKYQNFDFDLPDNEDNALKPRIWVDGIMMTHVQIEIPKSVIALSVMLTDKFPTELHDFSEYVYLGVKVNSNTARTSTFINKTISLLYESLDDERIHQHIDKGLAFLGYEKALFVSYTPRYKHIFFRNNLTVDKFKDFFQQFWNYTKRDKNSPPWSLSAFNRIAEKQPHKFQKLVDLCNKLSKRLEREYEGSRAQYFEFDVFEGSLSKEEIFLIKDLHALDLISSPSIGFKKNHKYFSIQDSSAGEYNFISGFIGLLAKLKNNSLILIDEPENSLHPNWQMKYISFLKGIFKNYEGCHFIITTHSHFLVSDLSNASSTIVGLSKDVIVKAQIIPADTYGWSAEEILLTIFKTPSSRNYYLTTELSQIFELITKEPNRETLEDLKTRILKLKELDLSGLSQNDPLKDVISQLFKKIAHD